jgi:hypothetical protein
MYHFRLKDHRIFFDIAIVRSILFAAAMAAIFLKHGTMPWINYTIAGVLLLTAFFTKAIVFSRRATVNHLSFGGAVLLMAASLSIWMVLLYFVTVLTLSSLYKIPTASFTDGEVTLKKTLVTKKYTFNSFNNLVLKDNLLTLDFKNNKVLQLEVEADTNISEASFNQFCVQQING